MARWSCLAGIRLLVAMALAAPAAMAAGPGLAGAKPGAFTEPGRLDTKRFQALMPTAEYTELSAADQLWRRRKFDLAEPLYATFFAAHRAARDPPVRDVVSYARLMEGMCLYEKRVLDRAIERFREVVESYPQSQDAALAAYHTAVCLDLLVKPDEALAAYRTFLVRYGSNSAEDLRGATLEWLVRYYAVRKGESKENHEQWLLWLDAQVRERPETSGFDELFEWHLARHDWAACRRAAGYRFAAGPNADAYVLGAAGRRLAQEWDEAGDEARRQALRPEVETFLTALEVKIGGFRDDPKTARTLTLDAVRLSSLIGRTEQAARLMGVWLKGHPEDRAALFAYDGYAALGPFDEKSYHSVVEPFLEAHPDDVDAADLYAKTIRRASKEPMKALRVLERAKAGPWKLGQFWKGLDDVKAAGYFAAVAKDVAEPDARRKEAAFLAAEAYRAQGRLQDAEPFYRQTDRDVAAYWLGECRAAAGHWREAVDAFKAALRTIRSDRDLRFQAEVRAAELLLANKQPEGEDMARRLAASRAPKTSEIGRALCEKYGVKPEEWRPERPKSLEE
jgi:hypothetical protein